jgi:alcohol oxidase
VSAGTNAQQPFQEDFFKACAEIGIEKTADVQDLKTSNAVGVSCLHRQLKSASG